MKKVAAVVVTYNRIGKLRNCLEALMSQTVYNELDILVIDNHSDDGTAEYLESLSGHPGIRHFNTGYNSGGAGGFCYGIRKAAEAGYSHVWLMDDDCVPSENALEELLRFDSANKGKYGFACSKVLWKDGTPCRMNIPRETVFRNLDKWDGVTGVEMASFVSLFIPMNIVMEVGLPFRKFVIWTDDWEYTRRISRNHPCWLVNDSVVTHDMDANGAPDISSADESRLWRYRYLYRNDVYLYRREGAAGLCYELARLTLHLGRIAVSRNSLTEKLRRAGILIKGTADGLSFFPEPERANKHENS